MCVCAAISTVTEFMGIGLQCCVLQEDGSGQKTRTSPPATTGSEEETPDTDSPHQFHAATFGNNFLTLLAGKSTQALTPSQIYFMLSALDPTQF